MERLVYLDDFAGETTGDLRGRERTDVGRLEVGHTLGRFDHKWDLGFLGAKDESLCVHVLLKDIDVIVSALVNRVIIHITTHFLEAELLDLALVHVDQIEHLELVGIQLDTKRNGDLDLGMFGEPPYGICA